ncbi:hypothetical protein HPB48_015461 [Haemaphysalis longicornis]|uniref:G-protein coupled receptors family 2 profile 1 domain-containing protein n=1 Tax=Haemaphysalis longicornis TaxID=44386 RepID=A0A9J6FYS2_HAELO|nr:hypothetical protein HPB48_015461 [Haemaphysalis longicornis]
MHPANYIRGPRLPVAASSSAASSSANHGRDGHHASGEKSSDLPAQISKAASTTTESSQDDYGAVQLGTHCEPTEETTSSLGWNETEGGVVAAQPCPGGYQGIVYRPCYNSGLWGASDYTDCRLERLANIRNLIYYHLHNNLIEGLYHLADDLARYLAAADMRSPMDRLDTMDTLNAVLQTKLALRLRNGFDIAFVQASYVPCFTPRRSRLHRAFLN